MAVARLQPHRALL
ncbi:hypothetical protein TSOC_006913 [Tetrabaena socialis]|uniref:Uncharacterized protein n=1 Tax=Tetrabaena socialis TaxID=47790 RepID=A0A2J8A2J0_9CHLO|nr:hypothetical protein TSOC_006913 [Tetrabaena socialis]|eukprot:PNH06698.1 hypothetical protein TSOC_006913 [Tetrabaena socialis]